MSKILVVDDERNILAAFGELLGGAGHEVTSALRTDTALARLQAESFELVVMDIRMPGMSGLDALDRIKAAQPKLPVIVMTGQGTVETAIEATKQGAFDYHLKPFEPAEMLQTVERALKGARLMEAQVTFGSEMGAPPGDAIVGRTAAMQEMYKAIGRVARTEATVLIRGESGTGKELVARAIYQHSLRCEKPLQVFNCAAVPETLLESELFGHERGAFTGAINQRIGKFEQAHEGTIFLDEIGDISLAIQAKILRVLQEKSFQRLGGNETICGDARVLTATNRNLERAIAEGTFRDDLYYRLNVVTIAIPPLRDRKEDISELIDFFLGRFSQELGIDKPLLSEEALKLLKKLFLARQCPRTRTLHSPGHDFHSRLPDSSDRSAFASRKGDRGRAERTVRTRPRDAGRCSAAVSRVARWSTRPRPIPGNGRKVAPHRNPAPDKGQSDSCGPATGNTASDPPCQDAEAPPSRRGRKRGPLVSGF